MSVVGTIESALINVSHEPLERIIVADDSWIDRAVQRIKDEADSADPSVAVAAFNSSL